MWGSLKRPSRRPTNIVDDCRSDDSDLCHEMLTTFGFMPDQMHRAAERFHLGSSKSGKTIYWMIDELGICHDGHLGDSWVSTMLKSRYPECAPYIQISHSLFGLHQISEEPQAGPLMVPAYQNERATGGAVASPFEGGLGGNAPLLVRFLGASEKMNKFKPIGIVESERSAVLLSELCPELLWMAYSYGSNCTVDKFEPLQGHKITLFPRADPNQEYYISFLELADQVKRAYAIDISVSSFLDDNATASQKSNNIDLVDYLFQSP